MKYLIDRLMADFEEWKARIQKQFDQKWREHNELFDRIAELERRVAALERDDESRAVGE